MRASLHMPRVVAFVLVFCAAPATAVPIIYVEEGGQVVGEGELFSNRLATGQGDNWLIVPDEDPGAGTLNGARGTDVQSLPDQAGGGGGPNVPPEIHYQMLIETTGLYELHLRWANNQNVGGGGNSDSLFVDIIELKDGTSPTFGTGSNQIADWYELTRNTSTFSWDGGGEAEINAAGAADNAMQWSISTPGFYTFRVSQREDGSAVDAFLLQLTSFDAPTGVGPARSNLYPEPGTLSLLVLGGLGLWRRRRKG